MFSSHFISRAISATKIPRLCVHGRRAALDERALTVKKPAHMATIELLERTDGYVVAVCRRLMLLIWRGQATAVGIERAHALFDRWAKNQTGGAAFLVVIPNQNTDPPDAEARAAMRRTANSPSPHLRGTATLIEAEGFIAATVRSVMTRFHGGAVNFQSVPEASKWVATLLNDPVFTPAFLSDAIRAARED
jgi:hypothetical protein